MPDEPGQPGDAGRLAAAAAELYAAAPEEFTGRRGELAAAARADGDRAAAQAITALRRPTRAAWVVNTLARADPAAPSRLAELSTALSAAQQAGQAARLRELSAERWALVDALAGQALAAAGVDDPPPALRAEVTDTLTAALADPAVAAEFAAGTLTRAAQWSGFGVLPATGAGAGTAETKPRAVPAQRAAVAKPGAAKPEPAARKQSKPAARQASAAHGAPAHDTPARRREAQAARQADEARQREAAARQAAADQAARRREQYEEAEQAVAVAASAAAEASGAEDQLEAEVRDLEQRLTQARADLGSARMRARRTEMAERRARQVLDRTPRPTAE